MEWDPEPMARRAAGAGISWAAGRLGGAWEARGGSLCLLCQGCAGWVAKREHTERGPGHTGTSAHPIAHRGGGGKGITGDIGFNTRWDRTFREAR